MRASRARRRKNVLYKRSLAPVRHHWIEHVAPKRPNIGRHDGDNDFPSVSEKPVSDVVRVQVEPGGNPGGVVAYGVSSLTCASARA